MEGSCDSVPRDGNRRVLVGRTSAMANRTRRPRVHTRGRVERLFERAASWSPSSGPVPPAERDAGAVGTVVVNTTRDDALGTDDLCGLLDRLARREVSPDELRAAALARAERANPLLNAVCVWVDPGSGGWRDGPFAGIPAAIKDNEDLAGYPTSWASLAVPDQPARANSPFVEQFLRLGLSPIAKTTLPEFGWTASTESIRFGATRNPWDIRRSAGGSSGGSAALVAAGVVPLAHGNDGGGSIRVPAAACGLVGLKASRGRIIDRPEVARLPVPLTVQGVLTRTVRDTARYLAEAERLHANPDLPPVGLVTGASQRRLRMGVLDAGLPGVPIAAASRQAVRDAAGMCEELGHHVEPVPPLVDDRFGPDFGRYLCLLAFMMQHAGGRMLGTDFHAERTEPLTKGLSAIAARSGLQLPTTLRRLRKLASVGEPVYESVDVLLMPSTAHDTPPIGHLGPDVGVDEHLVRLIRFLAANPVQNVTGSPALSLPLAQTADGLPMGVQLVAPRGHERRLLELGFELEAASGRSNRQPG